VGRLVIGIGIGASAIAVPAYLAEIAPAKSRGAVVQVYEVRAAPGLVNVGLYVLLPWSIQIGVGWVARWGCGVGL